MFRIAESSIQRSLCPSKRPCTRGIFSPGPLIHLANQFHVSATNHLTLNDVPISKTRNIGIIAHIDAGKTTTTERMLFYSGKINRIGNVDEGDTVTDYLPSERQRGITIQLAATTIPWNSHKINIIDTPGHADFTFEVTRSLRVLDGAVTILDAVAGVEAQTEKVWRQVSSLEIPRIAYVNKMDRPGAGFSRTVKEIVQKLQTRVVLCTLPYFEMSSGDPIFKGVIDVLQKKVLKWNLEDPSGKEITVIDIDEEKNPDLFEMVQKSRESMIETLGEYDETIIDAFFEHDEDYMKVPIPILTESIRNATISNYITPVFCGSSFKNIGVQPLMDGVVTFLPSPLRTKVPVVTSSNSKALKIKNRKKQTVTKELLVPVVLDSKKGLIINANPNLTVSLAFKVMTHATKGVMTFFRVYSGKLNTNTMVMNTRTGKTLLIKKMLLMHGDEPEDIKHINSGNIGVLLGHEDDIITGDTLVSLGPSKKSFGELELNLKLLPIEIPPPLFNSAIEPLTAGDEAYMNECVKVLIREDPSLNVTVDEDLGQTVLGGMGELHLDIIKERLVRDMKAKVRLRNVAVSYKEAFVKTNSKSLKKENPEANISIEIQMDSFEGNANETDFANEEGAIVIELDNNIIILEPSATPQKMHEAIEQRRWKSQHSLEDLQETLIQGCLTGMQMGGPIFGLSLHSTVIRIKNWTFPFDENSQPLSLLLDIGRRAITDYVEENSDSFGILEPIMETNVYVNSDTLGEVSHDLTHRCQAVITSIDDESAQNLDAMAWANDESENIYVPPDYTMKSGIKAHDFRNKKIIVAETPLREMIGYLSRLRPITQGHGTFSMNYIGMRRATKARLDAITNEMNM